MRSSLQGLHLSDEISAMPAAPDEPSSEMADPGWQDRLSWLLGDTSHDELGVLPSTMAMATAAMIFAARIVLARGTTGGFGGNFPQISEQKVSGAHRSPR